MIAPSTQVRAAPIRERRDDLYETPACVTHALLEVERLPRRIWEPAAGRGAIVKVLRAAGHEVAATDLVSYGQPDQAARRDFLLEQHAPVAVRPSSRIPPSSWPTNSPRMRWISCRAYTCFSASHS